MTFESCKQHVVNKTRDHLPKQIRFQLVYFYSLELYQPSKNDNGCLFIWSAIMIYMIVLFRFSSFVKCSKQRYIRVWLDHRFVDLLSKFPIIIPKSCDIMGGCTFGTVNYELGNCLAATIWMLGNPPLKFEII